MTLDLIKKLFRAEIASPRVRAAEAALVSAVVAVAVQAIRSQFGL